MPTRSPARMARDTARRASMTRGVLRRGRKSWAAADLKVMDRSASTRNSMFTSLTEISAILIRALLEEVHEAPMIPPGKGCRNHSQHDNQDTNRLIIEGRGRLGVQ